MEEVTTVEDDGDVIDIDNAQKEPFSSSGTSMLESSSYKCVVCGSSLQHIATLQGRLCHLKKCAKKHSVKASDFKKEIQEVHALPLSCKTNTQQSTIHRFFNNNVTASASTAPAVRSLNHVLMDNAKRLEKCKEITRQNNTTANNLSKKRPISNTTTRTNATKKNTNSSYCPAYKRIAGTDLICDGFQYATSQLSTKYFLSHFHLDHYIGLTSSWNVGDIYCSFTTANLVHQRLGVQKKYLYPLDFLTPTVIESRGKPVTVTLLDANHCPGASMFLFQIGINKTTSILHVGDFRWSREKMLQKSSPLLHLNGRLDDLYLDTTYCEEKYLNIPSQQDAIDATMEIIESELADAAKRRLKPLILFGSYSIGKERLYLEICRRLKVKAFVDQSRYNTLAALNLPAEQMSLLTTNKSETFVRIIPLAHINFKQLPSYLNSKADKVFSRPYDYIIGLRPTGWSFSENNKSLVSKRNSGNLTIFSVPYSEHSNFAELLDCLHCLKPKRIIPTVSVSKSDEQVSLLLRSLRKQQNDNIIL